MAQLFFLNYAANSFFANDKFISNNAQNGTIYIRGTNTTFQNCIFSYNSATNGGAIYAFSSVVNLSYSKLYNNYSPNSSVLFEDSSIFYISNTVLEDNLAQSATENCSNTYVFTGTVTTVCDHILCTTAICNCYNYTCDGSAYMSNSSFTSFSKIASKSTSTSIITSNSTSIINKVTINKAAIAGAVVGSTVAVALSGTVVYGYFYGFANLGRLFKRCCDTNNSDKNMNKVLNINKEKELSLN